jgi:N-acetylglucosaminyldiphosphoundecaprenol N-acetyl-beta-D-mannosaminyltransferase
MDQVLDAVEAKIAEGGFHQIATANVDFLLKSVHDEELHETLCRCDFVLADGMPVVWASHLLGTGLKERVTGADLVPRLADLSARKGYRIFLLGASEASSSGSAAWMEKTYPGVRIVGRYCPSYQTLEEMDHQEMLTRIEAAQPDILLVSFGNPKQEKWLAMHRHQLNVPVCIGVGATFDFLSGRVSRAPAWMQHSGLEWLYRTIQEPSRLAKRYASNLVGLTKQQSLAEVTSETVGMTTVLRVDGDFTGSMLPKFEAEVRKAVLSRSHVVVDMSRAGYIGADALGSLIHLKNLAHTWKRELWLVGLRRLPAWVVRATQLGTSFRIADKVAEALRRIEPELATAPQSGQDWAFCRIGGQLIPIHAQEVPEVYRQVRQMLKQRLTVEPIPVMASAGPEMGARIQSWFPSMPEESTASGKLKLISPKSETPYGSQWDSDTGSSLRETAAR